MVGDQEIEEVKIPYKYYLKKIQDNSSGYCYIEPALRFELDTLILNNKDDWDFIIIISGDRMTRTGKSLLAMNICAYLALRMKVPYTVDNIFLRSKDMMDAAESFPDKSVIHYDEGRETLAANKFATQFQKDLLDFLDRNAQKNHIWVIVLPDFFCLKEEIAVAKSEFLINVFRKENKQMRCLYNEDFLTPVRKLQRGFFHFYDRRRKQWLYESYQKCRRKNYNATKQKFRGRFPNNYPIDEVAYRKKKRDDANTPVDEKKVTSNTRETIFRNDIIYRLHMKGNRGKEISEILFERYGYQLSKQAVYEVIKGVAARGLLVTK